MTSRDVCDVPCNPSECAFSRTRKRPGPSLPVSSENEKYSQPSRAAVAASDRAAGGPLARSPSTESVARIGRPPPAAPHTSAVAVASCPLAVTVSTQRLSAASMTRDRVARTLAATRCCGFVAGGVPRLPTVVNATTNQASEVRRSGGSRTSDRKIRKGSPGFLLISWSPVKILRPKIS